MPGIGNTGRFGYTGQTWVPELGLWHYKPVLSEDEGARMYSPTLGRFMQTDPIGYGDGMNMYAYVGGDPVNGVDPTGLADQFAGNSNRCVLTPSLPECTIVVDGSRDGPSPGIGHTALWGMGGVGGSPSSPFGDDWGAYAAFLEGLAMAQIPEPESQDSIVVTGIRPRSRGTSFGATSNGYHGGYPRDWREALQPLLEHLFGKETETEEEKARRSLTERRRRDAIRVFCSGSAEVPGHRGLDERLDTMRRAFTPRRSVEPISPIVSIMTCSREGYL